MFLVTNVTSIALQRFDAFTRDEELGCRSREVLGDHR